MRHKSTELMGNIKAFVEEYYKNYRHSPYTTEIAGAVGIARGTAYKYLLAMSDNGMYWMIEVSWVQDVDKCWINVIYGGLFLWQKKEVTKIMMSIR